MFNNLPTSHFVKIAWRTLGKNASFSIINITGLTIGITCCILMVLFIRQELSYDQFHTKKERIVRMIMEYSFNGSQLSKGNYTSTKVLPSFKRNFPEVISGVRVRDVSRVVKFGDNLFIEDNFAFVDSAFFTVFDFQLVQGDPTQVLNKPFQLVLTRSTAKKYFGNVDPVGKTMEVTSNRTPYIVSGVVDDVPANSHIQFDVLASLYSEGPLQEETYFEANDYTYLLVRDKNAIRTLQSKIKPFMATETAGEKGVYINYELEPITSIHLHSPYSGFEANSNIKYVYIISGVALLVLLIACFTFINLSTAQSTRRAREVGVRKVTGAYKSQIFWQFISESILITFISILLSILVLKLSIPYFNNLIAKPIAFDQLVSPAAVASLFIILIVVAIVAGSYPALILSNYKPIIVLKGVFKNSPGGGRIQNALIVFQFFISACIITCTIIIGKQLYFIQNKNMGYTKEQVLVTTVDSKMVEKIDVLKNELKKNTSIKYVSQTSFSPIHIVGGYTMYRGDQSPDQSLNTRGNNIDEEYVKANGLELVAGTDISHQDIIDASQDSGAYFHYLLNESGAKLLGWAPQEAIGKKLNMSWRQGEVKGVLKDFHFSSIQNSIEPLVLYPSNFGRTLLIKTNTDDIQSTIQYLEQTWKLLAPHRPFEYHFMDDDFQKMYVTESRISKIFSIFSFITIALACLGLLGLSSFIIKQRMKEVSIRKVLGATIEQLVYTLSIRFISLVVISFLFSVPLVWFIMHRWLNAYAYKIEIKWWMFGLSFLAAILISFLTISIQAIKAAVSNPIKSLRSE